MNILLEKRYSCATEDIMNLFRDNTIFRLTGADEIYSDYKIEGEFKLIFKDRGSISGKYVSINQEEIILDWDVTGFGRPVEKNTAVTFVFENNEEQTLLKLKHENIPTEDSMIAKERAWREILDDIEKELGEKRV